MSVPAAGLSEGSASLLKDFAVAIAIASIGLALARVVGQPPVLGYLLAGLLIGPFTLPTPLISNLDTIGLLAELGLVLLLFGIGLELGWRRIRSIGFQVLVIGVVEISVLTLFGVWIASVLPGFDGIHGLYLGGAIAISSSAILLKGLRDGGNLNSGWGRTIVGILLVEDFAAVILLTVLAGLATTGSASIADAGWLVAKLGVFCIAVLVLGTLLEPRLVRMFSRTNADETVLLASLGLCFLLALCATFLGLSAAAGAFLVGVVIGDTEAAGRVTQLVSPVRNMFGALFSCPQECSLTTGRWLISSSPRWWWEYSWAGKSRPIPSDLFWPGAAPGIRSESASRCRKWGSSLWRSAGSAHRTSWECLLWEPSFPSPPPPHRYWPR